MATYELVCERCERAFEVFVKGFIKDEDRVCPACGSRRTRQKFSSFLTRTASAEGSACATPPRGGFG
jgi:putative FmdB family regulatory protein